jgi:hypothetical protein
MTGKEKKIKNRGRGISPGLGLLRSPRRSPLAGSPLDKVAASRKHRRGGTKIDDNEAREKIGTFEKCSDFGAPSLIGEGTGVRSKEKTQKFFV